MAKRRVTCIAWLLAVLLLSFASCSLCLAAPEKIEPKFKQIPIEQWQTLTSKVNLYEANLILVQDMLVEQERLSSELMSLLINVNVELNTARKELQSANTSLQKAEEALTKLGESYSLLKIQIADERKEADKREKAAYRKGWINGFCFGAVGVALGAAWNGIN